jgi:ABC-type branched-subunit amino acid transport system substrate-binding protein
MAQEFEPQKSRIATLLKKGYSLLYIWLLLPLLATLIGAILISRIANRFLGPTSYKIYVVGNMEARGNEAADTVAHQIYAAFDARKGYLKDFGGVTLQVVPQNDQKDPSQARQVAERISHQTDTLLVIGHIASSQTKEALPIYLNVSPPIPVILTTETNPDLVPIKIKKHTYRPVFRLAPTDKVQAQVAADLIARQANAEGKAIWVVQDISGNTVYSAFLANDFIKDVQKQHAKVVLWSTNLNTPTANALRVLNIGWVFFAGSWPAALVLIRELRVIYGHRMPGVVLSDASVHQELIDEGGNDVVGVYLTYPMRAPPKGGPDYAAYGDNACRVVERLFEDVYDSGDFDEIAAKEGGLAYRFRALMGIRRVKDARRVLASVMQEAEETRQVFDLANGHKVQFGVDEDGEDGVRVDSDAKFYIWRVSNKTFTDVSPTDE